LSLSSCQIRHVCEVRILQPQRPTVAANLVPYLLNELRGTTINRISSQLNERPASTEMALAGALPALLGGLTSRASTADGVEDLLELIRQTCVDEDIYARPSELVATPDSVTNLINVGRPLMAYALGPRSASIAKWISAFSGISCSSSTALLSLAAPILVGRIISLSRNGGLNTPSLSRFLANQKPSLRDAPAGLAGILGITDLGAAAAIKRWEPGEVRGTSWAKWAVPLFLLALLLIAMWRSSPPQTGGVMPPGEVGTSGGAAERMRPVSALGDFIDKRLPQGITLRVSSSGVENRLISYIEDPTATAADETWISFDRLEFETDSVVLKPSSLEQLRNVATILRAYPSVHVKIAGYTDNIGDAAYNLRLSEDRAINTMNELIDLGIDRSRLEAEGYGRRHPIADNATPEGRQQNRRIDLRVTQK